MIKYTNIKSRTRPQELEFTETQVFVASNIIEGTVELDGYIFQEFTYDYTQYTKDEYIQYVTDTNLNRIAALEEELQATKILLGVE